MYAISFSDGLRQSVSRLDYATRVARSFVRSADSHSATIRDGAGRVVIDFHEDNSETAHVRKNGVPRRSTALVPEGGRKASLVSTDPMLALRASLSAACAALSPVPRAALSAAAPTQPGGRNGTSTVMNSAGPLHRTYITAKQADAMHGSTVSIGPALEPTMAVAFKVAKRGSLGAERLA